MGQAAQCKRKGVKDVSSFKAVVMQYCDDRHDVWSRDIAMRCHGVHDLAAV